MIIIYIGYVITIIGLTVLCGGIDSALDKKMENKTNRNISVKTLNFGNGFKDQDNKPIPPIHYLGVD